jgi:phenazine biosynthesis protein phzE
MDQRPIQITAADTPAVELLAPLLGDEPPPFAVLHRPDTTGPDVVELLLGDVVTVPRLADLPLPVGAEEAVDLLAVVPYRQLVERGFDVVDDGAPLLALRVRTRHELRLADVVAALPDGPHDFTETGFDVPDAEYEATVRAVLEHEIARGEGSNFVIHRALTGTVGGPPARAALGVLRRLLCGERRAYWAFAVHTGDVGRTFVGASPERHVSVRDGQVRMNPISGTLRRPAAGWGNREQRVEQVLAFLADAKERDELSMVVDEELKMMAAVCLRGGRVEGPFLKEMAHLTHTEYVLAGHTDHDVREVLRATMFAPTVTGSPIRNACRVIARHERRGRGYYAGVLALIGRDGDGRQTLDAPILIRTAELSADGRVRVPAGATLVRGSQPAGELAETRAKAAGVVAALRGEAPGAVTDVPGAVTDVPGAVTDVSGMAPTELPAIDADPRVAAALAARNTRLAGFWLSEQAPAVRRPDRPPVTVVDAEDDFTAMFAHLLRSLGHEVRIRPWHDLDPGTANQSGVLALGPGPGDPRDAGDRRIAVLRRLARDRLAHGAPMLGVCLGHQVIAAELGLRVDRLPAPHQGIQQEIQLFGTRRAVGFYNSYVAFLPKAPRPDLAICADPATGWVHAVRRPGLSTLQFHPESVLTEHGGAILREELGRISPSRGAAG